MCTLKNSREKKWFRRQVTWFGYQLLIVLYTGDQKWCMTYILVKGQMSKSHLHLSMSQIDVIAFTLTDVCL